MNNLRSLLLAAASLSATAAVSWAQLSVDPPAVCPGQQYKVRAAISSQQSIRLFSSVEAHGSVHAPGSSGTGDLSGPIQFLGRFQGPDVELTYTMPANLFGPGDSTGILYFQGDVIDGSGSPPHITNVAQVASIAITLSFEYATGDPFTGTPELPATYDWLPLSVLSEMVWPRSVHIRVRTDPAGYADKVDLDLIKPPTIPVPYPFGRGTLTRLAGDHWKYEAWSEPSVYSCFQFAGAWVQPFLSGHACGLDSPIRVNSVFVQLLRMAQLQLAYDWVTIIRHPWLESFIFNGLPTGFSTVQIVNGLPTIACPAGTQACTNCNTDAVVIGIAPTDTEWQLASIIMHELVHTAQPCGAGCAECEAYCMEQLNAALTGIGTCDPTYVSATVAPNVTAECTWGCTCPW